MSEPANAIPTPPTSAVRNTIGKGNEQTLENSDRPTSDAALREYCDKYYHQLLQIIAEKTHKEKAQQEKLKEVKARLNFEGCSESRTPNVRGDLRRRQKSRFSRNPTRSHEPTPSVFSRIRRERSESPRHRDSKRKAVFTRLGRKEKGVLDRLGAVKAVCPRTQMTLDPETLKKKQRAATRAPIQGEQDPFPESAITKEHPRGKQNRSQKVKTVEGALEVKIKKAKVKH
ncbi:hypothetical protein Tco_1391503 [Tanacetum coccineum]